MWVDSKGADFTSDKQTNKHVHSHRDTQLCYAPAHRDAQFAHLTSDVCLSVAYIGPKSRTERPKKTKIGTEVANVTRDSDATFKVKRSKVNLQGQGHIVVASRTACFITDFRHVLLSYETQLVSWILIICLSTVKLLTLFYLLFFQAGGVAVCGAGKPIVSDEYVDERAVRAWGRSTTGFFG